MDEKSAAAGKVLFPDELSNDSNLRARLASDPKVVLAELGGSVPDDVEIRAVFDSEDVRYLHIPVAPAEDEIYDEDLLRAQGGSTLFCVVSAVAVGGGGGVVISVTIEMTTRH